MISALQGVDVLLAGFNNGYSALSNSLQSGSRHAMATVYAYNTMVHRYNELLSVSSQAMTVMEKRLKAKDVVIAQLRAELAAHRFR